MILETIVITLSGVVALLSIRRYIRGPIYRSSKRLDGKTVIVTGANTGIGLLTAKDLCRRGARVLILCRNLEKGHSAVTSIRSDLQAETTRVGTVELRKLDLASLASVRECARMILETESRVDILVLNAGVMMSPLHPRTRDGFEMQMGTNHLGHFLLTRLLMPLIRKTRNQFDAKPRIVVLSSMAHMFSKQRIRLHDINWEREEEFQTVQAYAQSKLANVLFAKELGKRLSDTGITTYSLHPGVILTELHRHAAKSSNFVAYYFFYVMCYKIGSFFIKTPWHGTQTSLFCCLDESIQDHTGRYYSDLRETSPSKFAQSSEDAKALWEISEKLTNCSDLPL